MQNIYFSSFYSDLNSMIDVAEERRFLTADLASRWLGQSKTPFNYMERLVAIVHENRDIPIDIELMEVVAKTKKLIHYFQEIPQNFKPKLLSFLRQNNPAELEFHAVPLCEDEEDRFRIWCEIATLPDPSDISFYSPCAVTELSSMDVSSDPSCFPSMDPSFNEPKIDLNDLALRRIKNLQLSAEHTSMILLESIQIIGKMVDKEQRDDVLFHSIWQSAYSISEIFENTLEEYRLRCVQLLAQLDPIKTIRNIKEFQINKTEVRFALAGEILEKDPSLIQMIEKEFMLEPKDIKILQVGIQFREITLRQRSSYKRGNSAPSHSDRLSTSLNRPHNPL